MKKSRYELATFQHRNKEPCKKSDGPKEIVVIGAIGPDGERTIIRKNSDSLDLLGVVKPSLYYQLFYHGGMRVTSKKDGKTYTLVRLPNERRSKELIYQSKEAAEFLKVDEPKEVKSRGGGESLCWKCEKSSFGLCSWSCPGVNKPVKGWTAEKRKTSNTCGSFYIVLSCPEFSDKKIKRDYPEMPCVRVLENTFSQISREIINSAKKCSKYLDEGNFTGYKNEMAFLQSSADFYAGTSMGERFLNKVRSDYGIDF